MSVLPYVERELMRVARLPLPDKAADTAPARVQPDGPSRRSPRSPRSRRSRRLRLSGVVVVTSAVLVVVIAALFVSVLHTRGTVHTGNQGPGNTGIGFPGAPHTQPNGNGVATGVCPLAAPNRYLPPRSGCVTVRRADIAGDGRPDLVLLYSRLSRERAGQLGLPARVSKLYVATGAALRVVRGDGAVATARVDGAKAAAIVAVARVADDPGDELFVQVSQISSGANAVAYGFDDGRLVPAGVTLSYGGDSATKAGFDCLPGHPTRLVQRTFELIGPTIHGWWNETDVSYVWHGPRLVKIAKRAFKRRGLPPPSETDVGAGCVAGPG
jgi:hypothetical protein